MALSTTNKQLLYEILGIAESGMFYWHSYASWHTEGIASVPISSSVSWATSVTRLEAILTALNAAGEARLVELLTQYHSITDVMAAPFKIAEGGVLHAAGLRINFNEIWSKLYWLRNLIETILGWHIEIAESPWVDGGGRNRSGSLVRS